MKARATRAPNIGELFAPPNQGFPFGLDDPCVGVTAATPGTLGTICRSDPGIQVNIADNGAFTLNDLDAVSTTSFSGGNPDVQEEIADSFTAGVALSPKRGALRGLTLTADYFDIEVADAIVPLPLQLILDQCFREGRLEFCDFVTRRASATGGNSAGSLARVDTRVINAGGLGVEGIDATLNYRRRLDVIGPGGELDLGLAYTHLLDGFVIPLAGAPPDSFAREIGSSRNRVLATLGYALPRWGFTLRGVYIGPAYLDDQLSGVAPGAEGSRIFRVGAEWIVDAQLRFTPSERVEVYLGADNLFDNDPPFISDFLLSVAGTGTGTDSGTYDAIGRRFYLGARLRF